MFKVFKNGPIKICGRQPLKFLKGCLPHFLVGPLLKTLTHIWHWLKAKEVSFISGKTIMFKHKRHKIFYHFNFKESKENKNCWTIRVPRVYLDDSHYGNIHFSYLIPNRTKAPVYCQKVGITLQIFYSKLFTTPYSTAISLMHPKSGAKIS